MRESYGEGERDREKRRISHLATDSPPTLCELPFNSLGLSLGLWNVFKVNKKVEAWLM